MLHLLKAKFLRHVKKLLMMYLLARSSLYGFSHPINVWHVNSSSKKNVHVLFISYALYIAVEPNSSELQKSILDKTKADTSVAVALLVMNLRIDAKRLSINLCRKYHAMFNDYMFITSA